MLSELAARGHREVERIMAYGADMRTALEQLRRQVEGPSDPKVACDYHLGGVPLSAMKEIDLTPDGRKHWQHGGLVCPACRKYLHDSRAFRYCKCDTHWAPQVWDGRVFVQFGRHTGVV